MVMSMLLSLAYLGGPRPTQYKDLITRNVPIHIVSGLCQKKRPQFVSWRGFKIAVANATDTLNIKTDENCRSMIFLVSFSKSCLLFWSPACLHGLGIYSYAYRYLF